ncbi:MAG: response regulator [Candidatus Zixiibacteriota bacterium]
MLNVLIVEDNRERIEFFRELYDNHIVFVAKDSDAAIELLQVQPFDIIQLDFMLEGSSTSAPVAQYIRDNNLTSIVIIHSTHGGGVSRLQRMLPEAYRISFSRIHGDVILQRQIKALLSDKKFSDFRALRELLEM